MKLIKFDLPLNGTKVRNLDELRDNATLELLHHYKTGLLAKFLQTRGRMDLASRLKDIEEPNEVEIFLRLCEILEIDVDRDIAEAMLLEHKQEISLGALGTVTEYILRTWVEVLSLRFMDLYDGLPALSKRTDVSSRHTYEIARYDYDIDTLKPINGHILGTSRGPDIYSFYPGTIVCSPEISASNEYTPDDIICVFLRSKNLFDFHIHSALLVLSFIKKHIESSKVLSSSSLTRAAVSGAIREISCFYEQLLPYEEVKPVVTVRGILDKIPLPIRHQSFPILNRIFLEQSSPVYGR